MTAPGLGGVAATAEYVVYSDRDPGDTADVFTCVRAADGRRVWSLTYPAPGQLDHGNSPRATPLLDGDRAYLFGAFGHLTCVELRTGTTVWEVSLRDEFEPAGEPKWGACSSPLLAGGRLVVNPGAKDASLAALDPRTGKTLWAAPGKPAGYGSLVAGTFGGREQVVGHDADSLGGWDAATGRRLWSLAPDAPDDFNVPTPVPVAGRLLVATENNGTRLYAFRDGGVLDPKPVAAYRRLAPDTHTPVVAGGRVFGAWRRLHCLRAADLRPVWAADDRAFAHYCAAVATDDRVLVVTLDGEFVLLDAAADGPRVLGRLRAVPGEKGLYAHPAFVGTRAYVRGSAAVVCLDLAAE